MPRRDRHTVRPTRRERIERAADLEALRARSAERFYRGRMARYLAWHNRPAAQRRADAQEVHQLHAERAAAIEREHWRDANDIGRQIARLTQPPSKPPRPQ